MAARLLLAVATLLAVHAPAACDQVVFQDDFDTLDLSVWRHDVTLGGGGNWEFELYVNNRSNAYVRDGVLYLRPTLTADAIGERSVEEGYDYSLWGDVPGGCTNNAFYGCERSSGAGNVINPVTSAKLRSRTFAFRYGRVEIKAKLPRGDWLWPALWLLPAWEAYGPWPASGEVDLMESRGNAASYKAGGVNTFSSTLHWGPDWRTDAYTKTHASYTSTGGDLSDAFHVYGLLWNGTGMWTYLDSQDNIVLAVPFDTPFWTRGGWGTARNNPWAGRPNAAPFDQEFVLIMNVACGGTNGYFPDGDGKPWSNTSPHAMTDFWNNRTVWLPSWQGEQAAMQIDTVTVWQADAQ